jgi:two-component system sensor histidine kinase/response regulator
MDDINKALILIVDDQPDNLDTIISYLSESDVNYKFSQAMNGQMACDVAKKRLPDLIIMDWEMPIMNGYDALIAIKNNPITKDIPIVMATGRSSGGDLDNALNAGAADYIRKPIEKQELLARVRTCLSISRLIKEIKAKNEELADRNREKTGMMSVVAHDLKSPLNNINGFIQLIGLEGKLSKEQEDYIQRIKQITKDGTRLITDLLDIHEYEHSDSKVIKSKVNLNELIEKWSSNYKEELIRKNLKLEINDIPATVEIDTDKIIFSRILDNLLTNAIKFSELGKSIFLKILKENGSLIISLRDEGPGISVDDQKNMFKMFQKLSAKPTGGESSNGLGLSIIKTLVEKLNGHIKVNSALEKGTEFIISLPLS